MPGGGAHLQAALLAAVFFLYGLNFGRTALFAGGALYAWGGLALQQVDIWRHRWVCGHGLVYSAMCVGAPPRVAAGRPSAAEGPSNGDARWVRMDRTVFASGRLCAAMAPHLTAAAGQLAKHLLYTLEARGVRVFLLLAERASDDPSDAHAGTSGRERSWAPRPRN